MIFGDFKSLVAAYLTREVESFTIGGIDLILNAANHAKLDAQRLFDFPQLNGRAFIKVDAFGTNIANAKAAPRDDGAAVSVKKIHDGWKFVANAEGTDWQRVQRYEPITEADLHNIIPSLQTALSEPNILPVSYKYRLYYSGNKVYLTGAVDASGSPAPAWVWLDVRLWSTPYASDESTDFFLTDYSDWLLFKTIESLNFHLKEDQRVAISARFLQAKWDSVLAHAQSLNIESGINTLD